ncbi:hypothetical protein BGZ47_005366 [Haplosporangium gracile]|nr:hypothetical protein BGZ47_005366 [Haplosporangium gracile]
MNLSTFRAEEVTIMTTLYEPVATITATTDTPQTQIPPSDSGPRTCSEQPIPKKLGTRTLQAPGGRVKIHKDLYELNVRLTHLPDRYIEYKKQCDIKFAMDLTDLQRDMFEEEAAMAKSLEDKMISPHNRFILLYHREVIMAIDKIIDLACVKSVSKILLGMDLNFFMRNIWGKEMALTETLVDGTMSVWNRIITSTNSTTAMSEPQQQPSPYGPRTLRFYIRESFCNLNTLEEKQKAQIEAHLTISTPAPTPTHAPNPNSIRDGAGNTSNNAGVSRKFLARGNNLERQNLVTFRRRYYSTLTALRDLINQLPEDKVVARKRYLRHLLMRLDKILVRMNFELSESKAATAASTDTDAGAVVYFRDKRKRRYIRGGVDGVDDDGDEHRMILRMHQDAMVQFIQLFRELATKYAKY